MLWSFYVVCFIWPVYRPYIVVLYLSSASTFSLSIQLSFVLYNQIVLGRFAPLFFSVLLLLSLLRSKYHRQTTTTAKETTPVRHRKLSISYFLPMGFHSHRSSSYFFPLLLRYQRLLFPLPKNSIKKLKNILNFQTGLQRQIELSFSPNFSLSITLFSFLLFSVTHRVGFCYTMHQTEFSSSLVSFLSFYFLFVILRWDPSSQNQIQTGESSFSVQIKEFTFLLQTGWGKLHSCIFIGFLLLNLKKRIFSL